MVTHENRELNSEKIYITENCYNLRIYFNFSKEEYLTARTCKKFKLKEAERRIRDNYLAPLRHDL